MTGVSSPGDGRRATSGARDGGGAQLGRARRREGGAALEGERKEANGVEHCRWVHTQRDQRRRGDSSSGCDQLGLID